MTENEHTLGYADVATLVGVSVETVRRWRQRGLPCVKPGARVRFSAREVLAWQNQQRPGQTSTTLPVVETPPSTS
jgi:excisionase family DNA binding protein